jgi:peptidoglycan/xylan/chitin deacetylase (PgdA/CDA1 family)
MGGARAVPILMYHNVALPPPGTRLPALYVSPDRFERQMRLLAALGFRGVTVSEGLEHLSGGRHGRAAVISLDDGYADNVENALPILLRHGFRATCFVTSGALGAYNLWDAEAIGERKPVMSAAQLREWVAAGMEVGAHTRTHPRLPALPRARLVEEVRGSRVELEDLTGTKVAHFCYPYGDLNEQVVEVVQASGFECATTVRRARARSSDDRYRLPRVLVREQDPLPRFLLKLVTPYEDFRGRRDEARRRRVS